MSHVYRVTVALPKAQFMTVRVQAANRFEAKARAMNQATSMGHQHVAVTICRKENRAPDIRPAPRTGGKPA